MKTFTDLTNVSLGNDFSQIDLLADLGNKVDDHRLYSVKFKNSIKFVKVQFTPHDEGYKDFIEKCKCREYCDIFYAYLDLNFLILFLGDLTSFCSVVMK